jgi:hypothetical protein
MATWELHDGNQQVGPLEEDHVVRMIAAGLPETTLIRPVGFQKWKNLRAHAAFAMALERAATASSMASAGAAPLQVPAPPPATVYVDAPRIAPFGPEPWKVVRVVRAGIRWFLRLPLDLQVAAAGCVVATLSVLIAIFWSGTSPRQSEAPRPPSPAAEGAGAAPTPVPTPQPLPAPPSSVKPGTWAKIPKPGDDAPDTGENRLRYMANVAQIVRGEPPINKVRGKQLLLRVRAELAKQASISLSSIEVNLGDGSGSIVVADGVQGQLLVKGEPRRFAACSEALLGSSVLIAGVTPEEFAKAGVRAVLCKSDGCVGIIDMRPTAPGGGVYGGNSCLSVAEMVRLAGIPVPE